jgi:hypothetical protein
VHIATSSRPRPWHEPVRITLTVLWIAALSLWLYYQTLFLYGCPRPYIDSATTASIALRTNLPLWLACFFPALAAGLGWYVFSHRICAPRSSPLEIQRNRLAILNAHFSFCTGCCTFLLAFRILPIMPLATDGYERATAALRQFHWGPDDSLSHMDPVLERWVWVAALAVALVITQGWSVVGRMQGRRRHLVLVSSAMLLVGLIVPVVGVHDVVPLPIPRNLFNLDRADPLNRALLLGRPTDPNSSKDILATFLETHDDDGNVIRFHDLHRNISPGVPFDEPWDACQALCELCLLPAVPVFTLKGIPIRLSQEPPLATEPRIVIELPRLGSIARIYAPSYPMQMSTIAAYEISHAGLSTDWAVLKADVAIKMPVIVEYLTSLREAGVRQVSLAAIPFDFLSPPREASRVVFGRSSSAVRFEPAARERVLLKHTIIVRKYIPPRDRPLVCCQDVDDWEYYDNWYAYKPRARGSVADDVSIEITERMTYGRFVAILSDAWYGGARTVYVDSG